MRCEEICDLASAWLDNELPASGAQAVAAHVEFCPACQAFMTDLRSLSDQIAHLGEETAPPGLENRIRASLAAADGGVTFGWRGIAQQAASLAAVCLLSVFGTWAYLRPAEQTSTARHDVVAAHVRSLLQDSPIQVVSRDTHTVRPWFSGKVEFAPPVKDLTPEGFPLVGGRLDYVDGHRVATLVYRRGLHTISVFIWPEGGALAPVSTQTAGLNLLSWNKDGMVWWAVSDAAADELRELRALL